MTDNYGILLELLYRVPYSIPGTVHCILYQGMYTVGSRAHLSSVCALKYIDSQMYCQYVVKHTVRVIYSRIYYYSKAHDHNGTSREGGALQENRATGQQGNRTAGGEGSDGDHDHDGVYDDVYGGNEIGGPTLGTESPCGRRRCIKTIAHKRKTRVL